jgi:hypothetical protein
MSRKLNVSEAARMAETSRATIHRRLKSGQLSINNGLIDQMELMAAFGDKDEAEHNERRALIMSMVSAMESLGIDITSIALFMSNEGFNVSDIRSYKLNKDKERLAALHKEIDDLKLSIKE